ncbi:alpha/beta hydrolase fold protein [Haliangium ochraceum DSM 14365]|uniref:Alpha/beta hydrolase fold protein n=1 Tax=Haliangium ochraceum (strain DSM 14365 / JCM 11303 / SMP-2) TaxID=502025 RepID=D0LS88_HALO1|nr:alpha/beta hydrolase fold protein [Haliangium ochraceum DSM 14365]
MPDAAPALDHPKQSITLATGIELSYVEIGESGGDTVILLHGYTMSSRSYFATLEALQQLDPSLHIFALDLRGHGDSSLPAGAECAPAPENCFELADFTADLDDFMSQQEIASAHIVGHSMGTLIAQRFALDHPERVDSLVLIGAFASTVGNGVLEGYVLGRIVEGDDTRPDAWQQRLEAQAEFGDWPQDAYALVPLDADPEAASALRGGWVNDTTTEPALLDAIAPETARTAIGAWLGAARMLLATDIRAPLAGLEVDALLLWGVQDGVSSEDDQIALRSALDAAAAACGAGYVWKPYGQAERAPQSPQSDIGHNPQWSAPAQVAADIHAFITTGAPTPELYYADPDQLVEILSAPDAPLIEQPAATNCAR